MRGSSRYLSPDHAVLAPRDPPFWLVVRPPADEETLVGFFPARR